MIRCYCELCVRFTGSEEEWEEVRALLEFGYFYLPQMDEMDADISDVVTYFGLYTVTSRTNCYFDDLAKLLRSLRGFFD